ncbi:MAG TPA: PhoU domain-containing protein [Chthoniobacterales bacterium]|jgi:phosphate transport system protein|nr:PhoU domain-containing protein [Chthoniobacterales bacterium]
MAKSDGRHLLPGFDAALDELRTNILLMGSLTRRNLSNAKAGFLRRDDDDCAAVIADDEEVDLLEKQVDKEGTAILLKFQPMSFDLRRVLATIKLGTHLERLSDQAVVIARKVRKLNEDPTVDETSHLHPLLDALERSLIEALDAFAHFDSARSERVRVAMEPLAEQARNLDDEFTEMVEARPMRARAYINLIAISQSLERIAYAIENVAEEAIYVSEARDVRHPRNALEVD